MTDLPSSDEGGTRVAMSVSAELLEGVEVAERRSRGASVEPGGVEWSSCLSSQDAAKISAASKSNRTKNRRMDLSSVTVDGIRNQFGLALFCVVPGLYPDG